MTLVMRRTFAAVAAGAALVSFAQSPSPASRGEEIYRACAGCHGVRGEGYVDPFAPVLAGLPAWYVARSLDAFNAGWRGAADGDVAGNRMKAISAIAAEPADRDAVSRHVAALPVPAPRTWAPAEGDAQAGARLFEACAICHGNDARGSEAAQAPPLAFQSPQYIKRQLDHFAQGLRGHAGGDVRGRTMAAIVRILPSEPERANVAAYASSLGSRR